MKLEPASVPLEVSAHDLHGEPIPWQKAITLSFEPFQVGDPWGGRWDTTWFRLRGRIPEQWAGLTVVAMVHLGGSEIVGFSAEGLVYDAVGRPLQGLHRHHRRVQVADKAEGGEEIELYVEAAANPKPMWELADWPLLAPDYSGRPLYELRQAELVPLDSEQEALLSDMRAVTGLAGIADKERSEQLTKIAAEAMETYQRDGDSNAARAVVAPVLAARASSTHAVIATGHAHIDTAWLWPLRETRRKVARTFANQLLLMERYPEHRFAASQALHYRWFQEDHPDLFERVKARIAEGRWEPVGGMWVEADSNLPSGESLVRQFIHGKRFFRDELGCDTTIVWIPDDFGYSAALPQIAAQAGITRLMTQKLSWNDTNRFPHTTFWWEGHDGSRLLAHFPPADTYNGDYSARELAKCESNHRDRDRSDRSLYLYGYGDGGGGPTASMLDSAARFADVEGLPNVEIGSARDFFESLQDDSAGLSTWVGEIYLEAHRGTYTTHADIKLANRRGEEALRAAEMWSVAAGLDRRDALNQAWERLLVQQFHDILPGSAIHWVYEDSAREHAEVLGTAETVSAEARVALAGRSSDGLVAFNPSSYDRTEVVELQGGTLAVASVPACGWAPVVPGNSAHSVAPVIAGQDYIDNGLLRVAWDSDGLLTSVWDLEEGREVLFPGARANLFQVHEDRPRAFDAWDVDRDYLDTVQDVTALESSEIVEMHPLRSSVSFLRCFGASSIAQTMHLYAGSRRLEFVTKVDWQERHRFLKVAFPVAVRSQRATYEIQHGYVERPTVANTSWDEARFEVCADRWADLSEPGYGVALLNDCKYGYDVHGHTLRLSLLRGPGYPDPEADRGEHFFTYALLPHIGDLRSPGRVVEEAEALNLPLTVVAGSGSGQIVAVDRPGVSVEAVKWADRGAGVVVRLCEVWGSHGPVAVTVNRPFASVWRTDLLERDIEPVMFEGSTALLDLRPFELVTLRLEL